MKCTAKEVLQYVEENDVKFVKLTFCDLFGRQRNVSIVSQQLPSIFQNGYLFNSSAVPGFTNSVGDLLLFPDPKTLSVLPWRPQTGEVVSLLSHIKRPDGSFYVSDTLHILDKAKTKLAKLGLDCEIATESEFYVFKLDNDGGVTATPIDRAGYFASAPEDEGENIRRDIILSLEDMGIIPTASHHEKGPGQNEIDFMPTEPRGAARNLLYFKAAVKNVCHLSGMHASFDPYPLRDSVCSGLSVTLTLGGIGEKASPELCRSFAAGVLDKAAELMPFFNTTQDSYRLLAEGRAPIRNDKHPDRHAYVNVYEQDGKYRIEMAAADCLGNPFLSFALLLEAGIDGIEKKKPLENVWYPAGKEKLPASFDEALAHIEHSDWLAEVLTKEVLDEYIRGKRADLSKTGK